MKEQVAAQPQLYIFPSICLKRLEIKGIDFAELTFCMLFRFTFNPVDGGRFI